MPSIRILSAVEQVAAHLTNEIRSGIRYGAMPGASRLARELGVNHKTTEAALRLLESDGVLENRGARYGRRIVDDAEGMVTPVLRIAILNYEVADRALVHMVDLVHELEQAGHSVEYAPQGLMELKMDVKRVAHLTKTMKVDAWVVCAGSRDVLEWFAAQETPVFSIFGRRRGVQIAAGGPDKIPAYVEAAQELVSLGHRRIVLLARKLRRLPEPGLPERSFLEELNNLGIPLSSYNLPDWDDDENGFHRLLTSLFQVTPPTAILVDEAYLFVTVLSFLSERGLRVPNDVSIICTDYSPAFDWSRPSITHMAWDSRPLVRRVLRWANNTAAKKEDYRQMTTKAKLIRGGTIGPAPGKTTL